MNFALGTVIVLFLLTPGIAFRYGLYYGPYSKRFFRSTAVEELFYAIIPAVIIQLLGVSIVHFLSFKPDLQTIYALIVGVRTAEAPVNFEKLNEQLPLFLLYNLIVLSLSFYVGKRIRTLIFEKDWDIRYEWLRLNNHWYYLLKGKLYDINAGSKGEMFYKKIGFIQIDALVRDVDGETVLYSGILENFYLAKDDGLDSIELTLVYRRSFRKDQKEKKSIGEESAATNLLDKEHDERYYNMPGDYFVIPYSQIINLNVTYLEFTEVEE